MSIPGCRQVIADVFIAETGGDMTAFPTAAHLASWAGVARMQPVSRTGQIGEHPPR